MAGKTGKTTDVIMGDTGNNILYGTVNADKIRGAGGNDTMTGGLGSDTFVFESPSSGSGNGVDTITDFGVKRAGLGVDTDILDLSATITAKSVSSTSIGRYVWVKNGELYVDINGGGPTGGAGVLYAYLFTNGSNKVQDGDGINVRLSNFDGWITALDTTAPSIGNQTFSYQENRVAGTVVASKVLASDSVGVVNYRFVWTDSTKSNTSEDGYFLISSSGAITMTSAGALSNANDFETGPSSRIYKVQAADAVANWSSAADITLTKTNLDEAKPVVTASQTFQYVENQTSTATVLATVLATDPNTDLISGVAGFRFVHSNNVTSSISEDGYFTINAAGHVFLTTLGLASLANDYETTANAFTYDVQARDAAGNWSDKVRITLSETNDPSDDPNLNTPPVIDLISNQKVPGDSGDVDGALIESGVLVVDSTETAVAGINNSYIDLTVSDAESDNVSYDTATMLLNGWIANGDGTYSKSGVYGTATVSTADNGGSVMRVRYALDNNSGDTNAIAQGATAQDDFTIYLTDGHANGKINTLVSFEIAGTNDGPTVEIIDAGGDLVEAGYLDNVGIDVATASLYFYDPDVGDTPTWDHTGWTETAVASGVFRFAGSYGQVEIDTANIDPLNGTLNVTYSLDNTAANALVDSETVADNFTIKFVDASGAVGTYALNFTVRGANDSPTISNVTFAEVDGAFIVSAVASDPDRNDTYKLAISNNPLGDFTAQTSLTVSPRDSTPLYGYLEVTDAQGATELSDKYVGLGTTSNEILSSPSYATVYYGFGGNDSIQGGNSGDTLYGGAGNDTLRGGGGADLMDGGAGADTLSYSGSSSAVTINLSSSIASGGDADGDTFSNIENIVGSGYNDLLSGDGGDNIINGAGGADQLTGGGGNDIFVFSTRTETRNANAYATANTDASNIDWIKDFNAGDKVQLSTAVNVFGSSLTFSIGTGVTLSVKTVASANSLTQLFSGIGGGTASTATTAQIYDVTVSAGSLAGHYFVINDNTASLSASLDTIIRITGAISASDFIFG